MEAGKSAPVFRNEGCPRTLNLINPLRAVWWLFTNVRFAMVLLALLAVVSLMGVLIPQMPASVKGDAMLERAWLDSQHDNFGFLTEALNALGLFQIFSQRWFAFLLAVTVASTGAYIVSRFPGVWSSISKPRTRVPDRYFDMAPHRVQLESPMDAERLEGVLRERRYKVSRSAEGETIFLFADRFQYAQLGTLLTHAAIIVFILSAVVQRIDSYESPLFLAEGSTLPVFAVSNPNQMQVSLEDAHAQFAADGRPIDYRSDLVIYDRGVQARRCSSTVNSPCSYNEYRFYQESYFGFGATVSVRDMSTGNVLYKETLALSEQSASPHVRITGSDGSVLLDEPVVLTDLVDTGQGVFAAAYAELPGDRSLSFWLPDKPENDDPLAVFEPGEEASARAIVHEGEAVETGGMTIEYQGLEAVPTAVVEGIPRTDRADDPVLFEMTNVAFGTDRTSAGDYTDAPGGASGEPKLTIIGLESSALSLRPGQSKIIGGYEYTFERHAEFVGIDVRRDRSDSLVWMGAVTIVVGLAVTFWVPRRRLWAKITSTRT